MKHLFQFMMMFTDLLILAAAGTLIYSCTVTKSPFFWIISALIIIGAFRTWKEQGGFIAWTKEGRRAFYTGWDEITKCEEEL